MARKDKKPEIRFARFTDAWELRKLSDYLDTSSLKNSNDDFTKSDVLSVSGDLGIINQIEFKGRSFAGASVSNYGIVDNGDVVYTKSPLKANPYGIIKTNKGKPGIVSTLYAIYKPKNNVNSNFIQCYFDYDYRINQYLKPLVNKGAKNDMKVSDDNALIGLVTFPKYEEQTRIVEFFECLNALITLHQRKYDKLVIVKKSMLYKMFPKNGANVPEIRFAGFTDAWEQRKVGDYLTESRISGSNGSEAKKLTVKLWSKGIVPKEEINQGSEATKYFIRKSGQFMYGKLDFLNQAFGIVPSELDGYESTLDLPAFDISKELNGKFFLEYVSRKDFYQYQGMIANGSRKAKRIHEDTFLEMPLVLPNKEEQNKIDSFFTDLDNLITLHQRQLEKLKNIKKAMLEKMFV